MQHLKQGRAVMQFQAQGQLMKAETPSGNPAFALLKMRQSLLYRVNRCGAADSATLASINIPACRLLRWRDQAATEGAAWILLLMVGTVRIPPGIDQIPAGQGLLAIDAVRHHMLMIARCMIGLLTG
jgi:hypothetical protein